MARQIVDNDNYLDRLYKLLPAEITGAYIGIRTLITPEDNSQDLFLVFFGLIILILAPIFYFKILHVRNSWQIGFLTFSYVVWAANIDIMRIAAFKNMGTSKYAAFFLDPIFIKGLLVIWAMLLVPLVLRTGDNEGAAR